MDTSLNQSHSGEHLSATAQAKSSRLALFDGLIFYGLVAVIVLAAVPYGTVEPWSEGLFECAIFFLTLLWIIHGFIAGSWQIGNTSLFRPLAALVLLAVLQSVNWWKTSSGGEQVWFALSADPFESWVFAFRLGALVLAGALVLRFTSSTKRLGILVHAIIAIAVGAAVFGILRQVMQHDLGFGLSRLQLDWGFGQFLNKNHFAFLIEMALGLVVGVAFMQRGRRDRALVYAAVLLLLWAAVILSKSRGGLLTIAVQSIFAVLLFVNSRRLGKEHSSDERSWIRWTRSLGITVVATGALLLIVVGGVVWLGGDQLATGVETASSEMGPDTSEMHENARRRDIWRATWLMFKAHPIAGAGLGGYWAAVPTYHLASGVLTPEQAHNDYLELLASAGILGVLLLGWFLVALFVQARQSIKDGKGFQRAVALGIIISLVGVGVHSIVDFGLHITINALVFVSLLGMLSLKQMESQAATRKLRKHSGEHRLSFASNVDQLSTRQQSH